MNSKYNRSKTPKTFFMNINPSFKKPKTFLMNTNPHKAQLTYMKQISSECYNFFSILQRFNITQIHVSSSLKHFKNRVKKKYNLKDYTNKQKPCIFFGMYNKNDRDIIRNHRAISFLMPGGTDFPNFQIFRNSKDITFIAISRNIQERFKAVNQRSILINLNLVNRNLFRPVSKTGNKIFIYDGFIKKPQNAKIYGKHYYSQICKKLPQYQYIFSSDLNLPYEKMPSIYAQCFIGLRLTANDGNANTVQEMEAMRIPVVHNFSNYGLKWKNVDDIIKHILNKAPKQKLQERKEREKLKLEKLKLEKLKLEKLKLEKLKLEKLKLEKLEREKNRKFKSLDFKCINIENRLSYNLLINGNNGDTINGANFLKNIQKENITLFYNNKFISGNKNLKPEITISRNKTYNEIINKNNVFISSILYEKNANGLYVITRSMIDAIKDKNSLLYPHVYRNSLYNEISQKPLFLQEQSVDKRWYNWATEEEIKKLKLRYFPENAFVICICGRIAINSYPKSLFEAIKILRGQGHNIQVLALAEIRLDPYRLTKSLYDEINGYDWVKSFTVDKKDVLNYFRTCDILASTYRDYCNHVGGSNKIKEYLLCNKPILCSRGKERENELGKNYPGFYDCKTCDTVPPLCWTREYIQNPNCYIKQYNKYFKNLDNDSISNPFYIYKKIEIRQIIKVIREYLKYI